MELKDYTKLLVSSIALLIVVTTIPAFAQTASDPNGSLPETTTADIPVGIAGSPYQLGDVFAGTGDGKIDVFRPDGTFVQTLDSTSGSTESTGMCFDKDGNLYATFFTTSTTTFFDNAGNIITHPWGTPDAGAHNESCVLNAAGHVYVGQPDGGADILEFLPDGTFVDRFNVAIEGRGSDWIDLAENQCTMFYTSEGNLVKRYDVCTDTQLADFHDTGQPANSDRCFALRITDNGQVLVACSDEVFLLNSDGTLNKSYPGSGFTPTANFLFALNLDPDGDTFWTGDLITGDIYRINIDTGVQVTSFNAPPRVTSMAGLAIFGERTVAVCPPGFTGIPPNCVPIDECTVDSDCDDRQFCTLDSCVDGQCVFAPNPDPQCQRVGGEFIGIETTSVLAAGAQYTAAWMIPVIVSAIGIAIVIARKF